MTAANSGSEARVGAEWHMSKLKISAKQVLADINAGMSNAALMEKYGISPKGLEALFKKLVDAGLLKEESRMQKPAGPKQEPVAHSDHAPVRKIESAAVRPQKSDGLLTGIAEDIKKGMHDGEIMRRYELSPGMLRETKEELVQKGYLNADHIGQAEAKKTKTCPHCSSEIPQTASKCVHCGQWLTDNAAEVEPPQPTRVAESSEVVSSDYDREVEEGCAWEERANYGTTKAYFMTAMECLMRPTRFFANLPREGGYFNPILFAVMSGVMSLVLWYLWTSLFSGGLLGLVALLFGMALVFVTSLIGLPLVLLILSALLHGSLCLVKGASEGFQTTFRVVSYSFVTSLFRALPIPYLASVASLWGLVLAAIGIKETHNTTTGKAAAAVFMSACVVALVGVILFKSLFMASLSGSKISTASTVPPEVCTALRTFVDRVDRAADLDDNEEARTELQAASNGLEEVLKQFKNHQGIHQIRRKALAYAMAVVVQHKLAKAGGSHSGAQQLESGLQRQRDELLACSGAK